MNKMNITPSVNELWEGIAGNFDSISQVLCELIDNGISNFEANRVPSKTVYITIDELSNNRVKISIEDTGTGISDFEPVLRLGDRTKRETPLNEHGFGLKHAIASANHDNNHWKIHSRIKDDFDKNIYRVVQAPYSFDMVVDVFSIDKKPWPGKFNGSGTIVEFECSKTFFNTIQRGIKGLAGFERCLDYLIEELGYIYAGVIEKGKVSITVASDEGYSKTVQAVKPSWRGFYQPGSGKVNYNLGGGDLILEYQFGEMNESDYVKHYKRNMSTSGVEIRVNGRVIMSNLFKEIWELENHPSYNHFLVILDLVTQNRDALPKTRTAKNGIRSGDERLEKLFEWIRKTHPTPHKDLSGAVSEKELVNELAIAKGKHFRNKTKHIQTEFKVFNNIGSQVSVDLYVYDGSEVVIYEAKKDIADVQNLYQLLMYWDGCVSDGIQPNEGILVASDFSSGVDIILRLINSMKDQNGKQYNFSKKTWQDEGINYPKP